MEDVVRKEFTRACLNHGTLSVSQAMDIIESLRNDQVDLPRDITELKEYIKTINTYLIRIKHSLKFMTHPLQNNAEYLVYIFGAESRNPKLLPNYSEIEMNYFMHLIKTIMACEEYLMAWPSVYTIADNMNAHKKLKRTRIQELIEKWTNQGYLFEYEGKTTIGPRFIAEFENYLIQNFNIKNCPLCLKIILWDIQCDKCEVRLHRACMKMFLRTKDICPSCKNTWNKALQ